MGHSAAAPKLLVGMGTPLPPSHSPTLELLESFSWVLVQSYQVNARFLFNCQG